ncbi:Uncharacterized protein OBRU01_12714 [Operophtera brumata]|uniref:Uncharacterized protein n=1 Tax=Operophtera brumata TaxID=104452 RepID=A0A0L7L7Q1_OPEBR|nr:Uncharacterized protein OBRU01_12714 [Operophtera brumata]
MEEMREIKGSMAQMQALFTEQMAVYEGKLHKQSSSDAPATTAGLAAEFSAFKSFMLIAMRALQNQIQATAQAVDQLETMSRRKYLLFHGVPEGKTEDTAATVANVVVAKLKMTGFAAGDINRCHRMGRLTSNRPRPILVKLRDVAVRDKIWFAKTNLKDSGITLSEFLTRTRHEVFMEARQRFGINKSWTREGYVFVVGPDDTRRRVSCLADLDKISVSQAPELSETTAPKSAVVVNEPVAPKTRRAAAGVKK